MAFKLTSSITLLCTALILGASACSKRETPAAPPPISAAELAAPIAVETPAAEAVATVPIPALTSPGAKPPAVKVTADDMREPASVDAVPMPGSTTGSSGKPSRK